VNPTVDPTTLPGPAQKILDGSAPMPIRQMAAKGIAPGLRPVDAITVLALLSESQDAAMAATATATLAQIPAPVLNGALGSAIPSGVLDVIAPYYAKNAAVAEKILQQPTLLPDTVARMAETASEEVCEIIAVNEQRLLASPLIIEKLYMNKAARMSTADRVIELAVRNGLELTGIPAFKEAAAAIANELISEPTEEPTPDDVLFKEVAAEAEKIPIDLSKEDVVRRDEETGEEVVEDKVLPLFARLGAMSVSQRIRLALLGSPTERMLLVRDKNKLVAAAAIRSPKIQDNEIAMISASRNVSEEVLRIIAMNKSWVQDHQIKLNLVMNPRTPFVFASRLMGFMREHELKAIAKSKNVSGAVSQVARQTLSKKSKG
jgi:CTP:molybdopterin cytidylyltransferase MocA